MSKAFTKEESEPDVEIDLNADLEEDFDDDQDAASPAVGGKKNYITLRGLDRLKAELHYLLTEDRPKVVETVAWAASNGDRSENADYQYGKRRLREIDRRVRFLQKRLDIAEVVEPEKQSGDKVLFGATVRVETEDGTAKIYRIVGVDETDANKGKVSWISPIGQALLQASPGDAVVVKTPRGEEELEIVSLEYLPIED